MIAPVTSSDILFVSAHRSPSEDNAPRRLRLEHSGFSAILMLAVARARALGRASHALLAIDLDGFTRIHASFGTDTAARLVLAVGERMRECLGPNDEMTHHRDDTFHVLVECGGNASDAWQIAELLRHQLAGAFVVDGHQIAITACIGVALVQPYHVRSADVVRDAYAAVHRAQRGGGGQCIVYDIGMHEATIEQLRLAAELRSALEHDEFRLVFQPILDCHTGELRSLEALIRWEHPERGRLAPAAFLPTLIECGLMAEMSRWVVWEACHQAVEWRRDSGLQVPIAMNVHPRQLAEPSFVSHMLSTIRVSGAAPEFITLEITEEIELAHDTRALDALRDLRASGIRVRIDDFGTGYSALSYLQRLPVDGLKLDRTFIQQLDRDPRRHEIVSAIINLAHVLGLDVVAEGVERREQLDALRAMSCDLVQGFFLSPPLSADDARALLQRTA